MGGTPEFEQAHIDMPKLSPTADRFIFLGVCCLIGIFSISVWLLVFSGSQKPPTVRPQPVAEIPVNETIRAVWDSGLYRENIAAAGIFWVDNDTILLSADNGPKPLTIEGRRARQDWLYLWRLGEKPQPYGKDPHAATKGLYCAARGEISYHLNVIDPRTGATSRTRWLGPPGHEREVAPWNEFPAGFARNGRSIERTDCEIYADPAMAGKFYSTDSTHRFYLDFGDDPISAAVHAKPEEPIVLMRADGSGRVSLPISNALARPGSTHFHMFDGVFYIWNDSLTVSPINRFEIWRETNCWPIWRVDPQTGKTERLCIPFGPWSGAVHGGGSTSLELAPTKAGFFFAANPIKQEEEHGLYRLADGSVSRILSGYVWSPSISPNGCRIAFIYLPTHDAYGTYSPISSSIVAIDVCSPNSSPAPSPN